MIDGRTIILHKSRCKIDRSNAHTYTILQLLSEIGMTTAMDDRAKESIIRYMRENKVSNDDLISLARVFPAQTAKNLMYSGVLYDFAQG